MYAVKQDRSARLDSGALEPLVARASDGDLEAFEHLVRTVQGPLRGFTRRMMSDPDLGDDAAQESLLRVWRGLRSYTPERHFLAWFFTIARNTCIEMLRRQSRVPQPVEMAPDAASDGSEALEVRRAVRDAIDALDEPYRSTFLLRESGFTYEEIADGLSVPLGTVRSRLHEARRQLAARLQPLLFETG